MSTDPTSSDPAAKRQAVIAARGKVRLGAWMIIAGTLGAVLALLTYVDVWNATEDTPTAWGFVAALCGVLAIGGFVVLWGGLTAGARLSASGDTPPSTSDPT